MPNRDSYLAHSLHGCEEIHKINYVIRTDHKVSPDFLCETKIKTTNGYSPVLNLIRKNLRRNKYWPFRSTQIQSWSCSSLAKTGMSTENSYFHTYHALGAATPIGIVVDLDLSGSEFVCTQDSGTDKHIRNKFQLKIESI